jgi:hypothetical protein
MPTKPYERHVIGARSAKEEWPGDFRRLETAMVSGFFYIMGKNVTLPLQKPFDLFHVLDYTTVRGTDFGLLCAVIVRQDLLEDPESPAWLTCYSGSEDMLLKQFEISLGFSYYGRYELGLVPGQLEGSPILYVFMDQGANGRNVSHNLYRVQNDSMIRVWHWNEVYKETGQFGEELERLRTTLDFTGTVAGEREITVTKESTKHERTVYVFSWNQDQRTYLERATK